jgi:DNA-binding NtrC family response regulator
MKAKILIVDDEKDRAPAAQVAVLEIITTSPRPTAAPRCKKSFPRTQPDVIVLDLKLPDANGLDLLPQIKKNWPDTEVIVLTGAGTMEAAWRPGGSARINFINKPFENANCSVT